MLPTVSATDAQDRDLRAITKDRMKRGVKKGVNIQHIAKNDELKKMYGLLPTPQSNDGFKASETMRQESVTKWQKKGLLPTPRTCMTGSISESRKNDKFNNLESVLSKSLLPTPRKQTANTPSRHGEGGPGLQDLLLPTPKSSDGIMGLPRTSGRPPEKSTHLATRLKYQYNNFLPTPRATEFKGTGPKGSKSQKHCLDRKYLDATIEEYEGTGDQLNLAFVAEMMGFPADWTLRPFLSDPDDEVIMPADQWENFPQSQPTVPSKGPEIGGMTFSQWRRESIKAYGNAVVPQVVFNLFKAIEEVNNKNKTT